MPLKNFHTIIKNTPEETKEDIKLSMDILDRIHELLNEKFDGKQRLLADKMGKTEAEVSKWLNGVQNFTIKTLVKLSIAFGEPIIAVCTSNDNATFEQVKVPYKKQHTKLIVNHNRLEEAKLDFEEIKKIRVASLQKINLIS